MHFPPTSPKGGFQKKCNSNIIRENTSESHDQTSIDHEICMIYSNSLGLSSAKPTRNLSRNSIDRNDPNAHGNPCTLGNDFVICSNPCVYSLTFKIRLVQRRSPVQSHPCVPECRDRKSRITKSPQLLPGPSQPNHKDTDKDKFDSRFTVYQRIESTTNI